ncbi:hypothetical protein CSQ90_27795 [Janthinobacterium sp. BJB303]|nr:hypothetical protein CSQ90_27795 [Janthinobacterium sp. BJB303]
MPGRIHWAIQRGMAGRPASSGCCACGHLGRWPDTDVDVKKTFQFADVGETDKGIDYLQSFIAMARTAHRYRRRPRGRKKSPLRERAESIFLEEDRGDRCMMPHCSI